MQMNSSIISHVSGQGRIVAGCLLIGASFVSSLPNDMLLALENNDSVPSYISEKIDINDFLVSYYDISDKNAVNSFVIKHDLMSFLLWLHKPITDIFGHIKKTLELFKCWDEEDYHITLKLYSGLDDMDEISAKEDMLFNRIIDNKKTEFLDYVVIAQR